ncbi:hypothetical protein [Neobacillus sp. D3-1R]|uniref:hypothetical protein n=1 Tax=Neobacillus sp. D3-1R TaxID=3445778 RepID=UPI003F9FC429
MKISLFIDFIIFISILFLLKKKHFHIVQYLFVFLTLVFIYSSFISIIVDNLELWKVKEKVTAYVPFRMAEIILFPMLTLWFIELFYFSKNKLYQCFIFLSFIFLPIFFEKWLIYLKIIDFIKWDVFQTMIVWFFFYLIALLIHLIIGKLLAKEGYFDDSSAT